MSEENNKLVPCTSCSKSINSDAAFCSFCGAAQKKQKKALPSQLKLIIFNLMCPGGGDWALGEKLRGSIICIIVIGALVAYCFDVMPVIQKAVDMAVKGNMSALNKLEKTLNAGNGWMTLFTIGYIFSFIDSFFLRLNKQKQLEQEAKDESA